MISVSAWIVCFRPSRIISTLTAFLFSKRTRLTNALVIISRFLRDLAGAKKAREELERHRDPMDKWYSPTPSVVSALKSSFSGSPY